MYTINYDNHTIYDPRLPGYQVRDAKAELKVSDPGSLTFTIDADHPNAGQLKKLAGVVELAEDGDIIYRGRIIRETRGFDNEKEIETEGLLACLYDSVIPPFSFPSDVALDPAYQTAAASGNVVDYFLGWLLEKHNAAVGPEQQIHKGTVTVTDPNNYISRSAQDYASTWDTINDKLVGSSLGGYLLVRYENDGTYVDYLSTLTATNAQPVEFGENLLDFTDQTDGTGIFTRIIPLGSEGLDISGLPDGAIDADLVKDGNAIYSTAGVTAYGTITRVETWDDVTVAANLRTKAAASLRAAGTIRQITVSAIDLHLDGFQSFRLGRMTTVTSAPHGFSEAFPLVELDIDVLDPANTEITLGRTTTEQTSMTSNNQRTVVVAASDASAAKQATDGLRTGETTVSGDCITTGKIQSGVNPDCYMDLDAGVIVATIWQKGNHRIVILSDAGEYYGAGIAFQRLINGSWGTVFRFWGISSQQQCLDGVNPATGEFVRLRFTPGFYLSVQLGDNLGNYRTLFSTSDFHKTLTGDTTANSDTATQVWFGQSHSDVFDAAPQVFATYATTGSLVSGDAGALKVYDITTAGFKVIVGGTSDPTPRAINWLAVGNRA